MIALAENEKTKIVKLLRLLGKEQLVQALGSTDPDIQEIALWGLTVCHHYSELHWFIHFAKSENVALRQMGRWALAQTQSAIQDILQE